MNAFGRRGGGGGVRAAARGPGGRAYKVRMREHPEGGWELIEDEEGPVLGGTEGDLGVPGGRFGRVGDNVTYSVVVLPDGFVVHQYPEGHLHVVQSPNGPEDVWLYREGDTHDAWKDLTAEVWEARRVKAEGKEAATAVKAVTDVTKAVIDALPGAQAPKVAAPPPVKAPPFPKPKPRVPALDAKPKRKVPWGVLAFLAAIGAVAVLGGGGKKKAAAKSGGEEG